MTKTSFICKHRKENIRVYLTTPENSGIKGFAKLTDYYQYHAPMIDSIHSADCELSEKEQDELIATMLSEASLKTRSKFLYRLQKNSLELMGLDGDDLCFKCARLICSKMKEETELASLLRHIRNSLAHGRLYVKKTKNQTYILLEDFDKRSKRISARILITNAILIRWKKLLISYL